MVNEHPKVKHPHVHYISLLKIYLKRKEIYLLDQTPQDASHKVRRSPKHGNHVILDVTFFSTQGMYGKKSWTPIISTKSFSC